MLAVAGVARGELGQIHPSAISDASLAAVAFLIVFGSLVAFTAYGWLLKNASTTILSTYAYVNPAVAVFLGWAFIGEHVGGREVAAGLVILSSIGLLVFAREARPEREPTPESLPFHIREQEARTAEVRSAPRLSELYRVAA
jgi:drug/metabolite transporter (DMT)-like permease